MNVSSAEESLREESEMVIHREKKMGQKAKENLPLGRKGKETKLRTYDLVY